jgi:hypothetical protein
VLIVRLLEISLSPFNVPVPFRTILVVPLRVPPVTSRLPPTVMVFPLNVELAEVIETLFVTVQLSANVHVPPSKIIEPGNVNPAEVIVALLESCNVPVPARVIPATKVTVVVTVNFCPEVKVIKPT